MAVYTFNFTKHYNELLSESQADAYGFTDGYLDGYYYQFDGYNLETTKDGEAFEDVYVSKRVFDRFIRYKDKSLLMAQANLDDYNFSGEATYLTRYNELNDGYEYYIQMFESFKE